MADSLLAATVAALDRALGRAGARSMFIGGVAVIAQGVRRLTDDVDVTVWAPSVEIGALLRHLASEGIVPRIPDVLAFAQQSQALLLRHERGEVDVDVSLAWLPFESAALDRADTVAVGRRRVRVATPDDLIVYKAIAARQRDLSDVQRLLELHANRIDFGRVRRVVSELAGALERPELIAALEALIADASHAARTARTRKPAKQQRKTKKGTRGKKKRRG